MDYRRELSDYHERRRRLPHHEQPQATYFIRFSEHRPVGVDLTRPDIAPIIVGALRFFDGQRYWLYDYTAMRNHVHAILKPIVHDGAAEHLWQIIESIKGWSARRIDAKVGRRGCFWRDETYNRIIRNEAKCHRWAECIFRNPVAADLIDDPAQRPWWGRGSGQYENTLRSRLARRRATAQGVARRQSQSSSSVLHSRLESPGCVRSPRPSVGPSPPSSEV